MRRFLASLITLACCVAVLHAQAAKDTDAAAKTRKLLDTKISVDYEDSLLQDVVKDLSDKVKEASKEDFPTKIDLNSGASQNMKIKYTAKNMTVAEILDGLGKKHDLGYIIISGKYKTYYKFDGYLLIVKGTNRGYPDKTAK